MESIVKSVIEGQPKTKRTKPGKGHSEDKDKELESVLGARRTVIRVIGVGGGGNNTLTRLVETDVKGIQTLAVNTDAQDLLYASADQKILIGKTITAGLGAGSDPSVGEDSARENHEDLRNIIEGSDMVFVTCGLGGGTGTGSAPVIAEIAKSLGALTIAVVTLPFSEEGVLRWENAQNGLEKLKKNSDTVIVVQNDRLLEIVPDVPLNTAFKVADEILVNAVMGITDLVTEKGLVNLDFADVRAVMTGGGTAMIGMGESESEENAMEAVQRALKNPLSTVDITGARSALINITGGNSMTLKNARAVMKAVSERLDPTARVIWGARVEEELHNGLRVLLIVTGLQPERESPTADRHDDAEEEEPQPWESASYSSPGPFDITEREAEQQRSSASGVPGRKSGRVFVDIFQDEIVADLTLLRRAVEQIGIEEERDHALRDLQESVSSIKAAAELFSFEKVAELASMTEDILDKIRMGQFEFQDDLIPLFAELPDILDGILTDEDSAYSKADGIVNTFVEYLTQGIQLEANRQARVAADSTDEDERGESAVDEPEPEAISAEVGADESAAWSEENGDLENVEKTMADVNTMLEGEGQE